MTATVVSGLLFCSTGDVLAQSGVWTTNSPMLQPRIYAAAAVVGGRMIVLGGNLLGFVAVSPQLYDPLTDTWVFGASASIQRSEVAAGMLNNKVYVAGGWIRSDSGLATGALEIYDPATDSWTNGASMSILRGVTASAAMGGKLYVAGGYGSSHTLPNLEIYNPVSGTWSAGAPLPFAVAMSGGAAIAGKFYVVGGYNTAGSLFITGALQIYDPATDSWTSGVPMPTPRYGAAVGVIDGKLIVVGGYNGNCVSTVEIYDPVLDSWTTGAPLPEARTWTVAGVLGSQMFVAGGNDSSGAASGTLQVYTPPPVLTNIMVTPTNPIIGVGTNQQFSATGQYGDGSSQILTNGSAGTNLFWSGSSPTVASIDTTGAATGLTNGVTTITATSGSVSGIATLTVVSPPAIAVQPTNNTVSPNGSVILSIGATGGGLSYQWQLNGTNINGATGASLTITNVSGANVGVYTVIVNNAAGSVTSSSVTLASVDIKMFAGVIVNGQLGSNYLIQATSNLASGNWTTLTNVALLTQPYVYIDYSSPTNSRQFYRAVPQ